MELSLIEINLDDENADNEQHLTKITDIKTEIDSLHDTKGRSTII